MGGKSGKPTIGYWYDMDVLATACLAADEVVEFVFADRTAWIGSVTESGTISIYKDDLFGGAEREGGVFGQVDIMLGDADLPVNEFLGSSMRKTGILGPVPAYRNSVNFFFRGVIGVDSEFAPSGVFDAEGAPPPLDMTPSFTSKLKSQPKAFRWSAMNPYFKPFKVKLRRYTKDWHPEIAKIPTSTLTSTVYPYELSIPANAVFTLAPGEPGFLGVVIHALPTEKLVVRKKRVAEGATYDGWSPWSSDDFPGTGKAWQNGIIIASFNSFDDLTYKVEGFWSDLYASGTEAESAIADKQVILTGYSMYKIGIQDSPYSDNRGGISLIVDNVSQQRDMNPAHIIRECLTDLTWGLGWPTSDIDDVSFLAAAQTLFDEGFGLSFKWSEKTSIEDFIIMVARHINAVVYQDRSSGKLKLKLIRNDYVVGDLIQLDPSNSNLESISRAANGDIVNEINLTYLMPNNATDTITLHDLASIQTQGQVISQDVEMLGIRNATLAARVAQRELDSRVKPIAKIVITTNRIGFNLYEGGVFKLSWPDQGISSMVCRVVTIDLGTLTDNAIRIEAVQDVFGLPTTSYIKPTTSNWVDPNSAPVASPLRFITETPYYTIARSLSDSDLAYVDATDCYIDVYSVEPSGDALDFNLWSAIGSNELTNKATGTHVPEVMLTAIAAKEETSVLHVSNARELVYLIESDSACVIIEGEYAKITDYDTDANTITVNRAVLDTTLATHAIGTKVILSDFNAAQDEISYLPTEVVSVKVQTRTARGILPIAMAPVDTYTIQQRQARPYPPGKVRVNGNAYPATIGATDDLALTWAHRNRLTQTADMVAQSASTITPEVGTTYNVRIYGAASSLLRSVTALTTEAYNYTTAMEESDMGGLGGGLAIDQYWDKTVLLANMNGANASTTFLDVSPNFAIANGDVKVTSAQTLFSQNVAIFDGAGDYLNLPYLSNYSVGSANFTIEYWFRATSMSLFRMHFEWRESSAARGIAIYQSALNKLVVNVGDSNTSGWEVNIIGTTTLVVNTFYHVRFVRNGTNWQLYLNGVSEGSATSSVTPYTNLSNLFFGVQRDLAGYFVGQAADLRITLAARNTSGFTTPTQRLAKYVRQSNHSDFKALLTFDGLNNATTTTDSSDLALPVSFFGAAKISTTQSKFGGSSLSLDGVAPSFAEIAFDLSHAGAGTNLTVECFFYANAASTQGVFASRENLATASANTGWKLAISNTNRLYARGFDASGAEAFLIYPTDTVSINTWHHVALVRNGTTWTLFFNGTAIGSAVESAVLGVGGNNLAIGRSPWYLDYFNGYIDDFCIRASAVYTGTFSVPTSSYYPLDPYWANTVVLIPMSGANNSTKFENIAEIAKLATPSGNAQVSTAQSKFGGASGLFDGAGDYITFEDRSSFHLDGDFTIECWLYGNFTGGDYIPILSQNASLASNNNRSMFFYSASTDPLPNAWTFYDWTTGTNILVTATDTPPVNTWFHLALSKQGNNYKFFRDGTQVGTTQVSAAAVQNVAGSMYIGAARLAGVTKYFNGYIDDLRITKAARYPGAFSVSTLELGKYVPALNTQLTFELESQRDGLVSWQKHRHIVARV